MSKTFVFAVIAMLNVSPVQAQEASKKTPKSFEEKKEIRLERAGMNLYRANERYNCIKAAQTMTEMNSCNKKKKPAKK